MLFFSTSRTRSFLPDVPLIIVLLLQSKWVRRSWPTCTLTVRRSREPEKGWVQQMAHNLPRLSALTILHETVMLLEMMTVLLRKFKLNGDHTAPHVVNVSTFYPPVLHLLLSPLFKFSSLLTTFPQRLCPPTPILIHPNRQVDRNRKKKKANIRRGPSPDGILNAECLKSTIWQWALHRRFQRNSNISFQNGL